MKKYGIILNDTKFIACCSFKQYDDTDAYFGTDDINIAYKYITHCSASEQEKVNIFDKVSGQLITK